MMNIPEDNGRIIIFLGSFQYDATNAFAEELGKALSLLGREVLLIDKPSPRELYRELRKGCSFAAAFNGVGSDIAVDGENIFNMLNVPLAAIFVDHPVHHLQRLCGNIKDMTVFCYDASHKTFLDKYFVPGRKVCVLPHAGIEIPDGNDISVKDTEILFPATYTDENRYYEIIRRLSPSSKKFTEEIVEIILSMDCPPTEEIFLMHARASGFDFLKDTKLFREICPVISTVEFLVRTLKRQKTLKLLDEAGIKVDIYGNGWKKEMFGNHRVFPPASFRQTLENMRRSKIVLNAFFIPGSHERVFSAMLNGAVSASDANPFLERNFVDRESIILYRWTEIEKLPGILSSLLRDENLMNKIIINSRGECLAKHTWRRRAEEFLSMMCL